MVSLNSSCLLHLPILPIDASPFSEMSSPFIPNGIHRKPEACVSLPTYANIPPVPGLPHGCTWGLWDTPTHRDELGTLNLLTPSVVCEARNEIQSGIRVAINWSLDNCSRPHSQRRSPEHRIIELLDWIGHDDEISVNTQSGSQWDGLSKFSERQI